MTLKIIKPLISILVIASILLLFFFPRHYAAISHRFSVGSAQEGVTGFDLFDRIIFDLTNFYKELAVKIPELGLGIGYSSNAALVYNLTVIDVYSENEWGRHILELGPYFGFLMIAFRVYLFLYLLFISLSMAIKLKSPCPGVFFAAFAPFLLFGQLTGNGIAGGMVWFMTGLFLAIVKDEQEMNLKQIAKQK